MGGGGVTHCAEVKIAGAKSISYTMSSGLAVVTDEFRLHEQFVQRVLTDKVLDQELISVSCRRSLQWHHLFLPDCKTNANYGNGV